jgi:hypothetical protein
MTDLRDDLVNSGVPVNNIRTAISPFKVNGLSVLCYANGFTQWHYKTGGELAKCIEPGYFRDCFDLMHDQDIVHITACDGSALCVITGATGATVRAVMMVHTNVPRIK